jgi:Flp pilus assembly protein TadG
MVGAEGESGAALVEFTILTPMLVIASIYTMDYGLLFYNKLELQNAAQAGAQWAVANRIYNHDAIQTAGQNAIKSRTAQPGVLGPVTINSSQFCGCSKDSGGNPNVTQLSGGSCTASSSCTNGVTGTYVSVVATPTTNYQSLIPYRLVPSTSPTATSTVRIQ